MNIVRAYKTELDPSGPQAEWMVQCAGAARFVYNWALADRKRAYEETGVSVNIYEQKRRFNALKHQEYPWLAEIPYTLVQEAFANVDAAYKNFFRRVKNGDAKKGFPKFKNRDSVKAFTLRGRIHVDTRSIKLPRIGWVRLKEVGYLPRDKKILSANISCRAGRWFVSLSVEEEIQTPVPQTGRVIGIDVGIKQLATCSNGKVFENPHSLREAERKLATLSRELSRRQKGGKNRAKTKEKIARLHHRISNVRRHSLHEVSHYAIVTAHPSAVVVEDLNVAGMVKNRHLSKAVADASMSELRRQIEYKATWHGGEVVVADRFYPSSKTCSTCGAVKASLALSEREYVCEQCGMVLDRGLNAARNLAALVEGPNGAGLPVELGCSNVLL